MENITKLYSIGEVSNLTGLKQSVIRFWETEFQEITPKKNKFGHRVYSLDDIKKIQYIKKLLYKDKYTIDGAKNILKELNLSSSKNKDFILIKIRYDLIDMLDLIKNRNTNDTKT